ncbi:MULTISPECIES: serine/threonine-protein kinase [unclassified Streptomyces]|uniref:serine/threonine-protein kinase n=1 Tax=unclassified Streptomyces TaxID=2593676 RepID=UPI002E8002DF|nr:serine/threonine-protein kinase [Streptomyces sp. NBC_00589]WTI34268.1 serine/threonine protein kinase [Streptomyces sp. NBC_00775]WUB32060.1 serine/threonine protein kinase [Streptomyces sp. NBC_00589]
MLRDPLERIGRYRLDRRLGAGGFGVVWLAHDDVLEAAVAVKVLSENWVDHLDIRERFLSEARLLRRADSSRVVQVYDIGELPDGRPYFVMEYADGGTLADRLEAGPLPVAEALRLTALAARGAAALHEAGIVHRDIKPSNVLLRTAPGGLDRVLLADLGLAKSLAQASGLTMAAGSAGYTPPEQAAPGSGIDARADVYSLGALGYHLVTGTVPGPPGKVVRPDRLRTDLAPDVQRALLRAMEPDRERRWPTAAGFAAELERLADPGAGPRPPRRRRRAVITVLAAAVVACAVGVTAAIVTRGSAAGTVRVEDSTGRVTAEVPAAWGHQLRDSGWNPRALGLKAAKEPGLAVADDLTAWQDLGSDVNGAFIGLSEQGDVTAEVRAVAHTGCHYDGSRTYTGAQWHGLIRTWSGCPGSGGSLSEAGLTPAGGAEQPQVYVQIRQDDGDRNATDRVLGSVRVGD